MDIAHLPKREQVFVSSTYEDLKEERRAVTQRLLELRCIPAGMELFPASSDDKWNTIRRVIAESDYYLLVIGGRYGSTVPGRSLSYTQREYEYAKSLNKPILAFIRNPETLLADRVEHDPDVRQRLDRFREDVKSVFGVKFWSSPDELGWQVMSALMEARERHPAEGWVKASELRAHLGLTSELVEALAFAGIEEIAPGVGGVRDRLVFDRLPAARRIDVFANTAYHFLELNEGSLIEALRNPECRIRVCISEPDGNPLLEARMFDATKSKEVPVTSALCPAKDLASEIRQSIEYLREAIYSEARRSCERQGISGPGRVEVYKYRGIPSCGFIFVDEELGRLVPYVPFAGSAQSPAFVFRAGNNERGRLFGYLWGKYCDILDCIGEPFLVLST